MLTHNHVNFISQAIESVLVQKTNFPFEIVLHEDCSTDGTRDIVLGYKEKYPNKFRLLLPEKNIGVTQSFNNALQACNGQYIAFLEGDDYWTNPDKLQKQVDFLEAHPDCSTCCHPVLRFIEGEDSASQIVGRLEKNFLTVEDFIGANPIFSNSLVYRNRLIDGFPEWLFASKIPDWVVNIFNVQHGQVGYIEDVMAAYRVHSGGIYSSRPLIGRMQDRIYIFEHLDPYLNYKFHNQFKIQKSRCWNRIASAYYKEGQFAEAWTAYVCSIRESPNNLSSILISLLIRQLSRVKYEVMRELSSAKH